MLNAASAESNASSYEAFRAALRQLGYVEGRNVRFEYRYADGFLDRLPALAEELVRLNPRVIVSGPLPRTWQRARPPLRSMATWMLPLRAIYLTQKSSD